MKTILPLILSFVLAIIVVSEGKTVDYCNNNNDPTYNWDNFKKKYNKHYTECEELRKKIFLEKVDFVKRQNCLYQQGKETIEDHLLEINKFADLLESEVPQGLVDKKKKKKKKKEETSQ